MRARLSALISATACPSHAGSTLSPTLRASAARPAHQLLSVLSPCEVRLGVAAPSAHCLIKSGITCQAAVGLAPGPRAR